MQIEYCEGCKTKLTELSFKTGQAVWLSNQPFCKACGEKAAQAKATASRSGPRAASAPTRPTTPPGRSTPGHAGRRPNTPGTAVARRSGLHRAPSGEPAKSSDTHTRHSSPHDQAAGNQRQSPSMVVVSIVGAAIGVLLAVLVIMVLFR